MFDDYKRKIVVDYKKKRDEGLISLTLVKPTPGSLRKECLHVYAERHTKKDNHTLRLFFGPLADADNHGYVIRRFDLDKFRPLANFLNGKTDNPDEKNIELLAWLIDFEPRPYKFDTVYNEEVKPGKMRESEDVKRVEEADMMIPLIKRHRENENNGFDPPVVGKEKKDLDETEIGYIQKGQYLPQANRNLKVKRPSITGSKKIVLYFIAAAAIAGGIYPFAKNNNQGCMFWKDDHYQPVSCEDKVEDAAMIALDTFKVAHLRKINRPDTLTKTALGKVWYVKINVDSIEFYTAEGFHPIYTEKKLKPITVYIVNKYVL